MGLLNFFKNKSEEAGPDGQAPAAADPQNRDVRFEELPRPETSTAVTGREPIATAPDPVPAPEESTEAIVDEAVQNQPQQAAATGETAAAEISSDQLRDNIVKMVRTIYDPEIPVNIYDLGLIYSIDINETHAVHVNMTLTAPNCPAAGILPGEVESKIRAVPGVSDVKLDLVWEPSWNRDMMSEAARLELGF